MESQSPDWSQAYRHGDTPWDLRGVTPALEALVGRDRWNELGLADGARIAVPGCGRGHDVRFLAAAGYAVTGFDLVPEVVAEAQQLLRLNGVQARVLCRDVLGLLPEFEGAFDLVYDYTCYCALPPYLRDAYAGVVAGLLAPGGRVLQLAFPMTRAWERPGRPPYQITAADAERAFQPFALMRNWEPEVEDHPRKGAERFYLWRRG